MRNKHETQITAADLRSGEDISLSLDSELSARSGAATHIYGVVTTTRPKAVRIELVAAQGGIWRVWIPRRALTHLVRDNLGVRGALAAWWQPDDEQARAIDACRETGTLTA